MNLYPVISFQHYMYINQKCNGIDKAGIFQVLQFETHFRKALFFGGQFLQLSVDSKSNLEKSFYISSA